MARDILVVPISTVASESTFSTSGRVLDCFRSSLSPKIVEALICTQDWLRNQSHPISIEENIDEVQRLETELIDGNVTGGPDGYVGGSLQDPIAVKILLFLLIYC
ncbi:unnamed protein product [Cuscuta epithymum]|uniref:HAT C-terminal dimerisation domain-containing protein n=1 Tax=Cuscuta epithymum TaxID=186058 RepID=A0AAV0C7W4_9ASTE|nr:unnamed protein product [Cuscuta epithymum]